MTFLRTSVRREEILSRDAAERASAHQPILRSTRLHRAGREGWCVEFTYSDGSSRVVKGPGAERGVPALA